MKTFYITFGLGTILAKSYLVAYAPDENTLRVRLNEDYKRFVLLQWCSLLVNEDTARQYNREPLPTAYEAVSIYNSRPCGFRQER